MRRYIIFGFAGLIPFLFGSGLVPRVPGEQTLILKLRSSDQKEVVTFEGCYFFKGTEASFRTVKLRTPFQTEAPANIVAAIFHKNSGKADLVVELETRQGDKHWSNLEGHGTSMVLFTNTDTKPFSHGVQVFEK